MVDEVELKMILDKLELCDLCALRLRVQLLERALSKQKNPSQLRDQHALVRMNKAFKSVNTRMAVIEAELANIKTQGSSENAPISYEELCDLYPGYPLYKNKQTTGFKAFLREKGHSELIQEAAEDGDTLTHNIQKKKQAYRAHKENQKLIEQNKTAGYVLP